MSLPILTAPLSNLPENKSGEVPTSEGYAISADGTRIHWYTAGEDEPTIVCCDGIGCDGYVWKYLTEDFSRDHRVVRWHYRAHGSSHIPNDRSRMRLKDLCDDLLAVIDAHQAKDVILVGHSLGVQVILEFWKRHPDRVKALVPMCGSYGRPVDTFADNRLLKRVFPYAFRAVNRHPLLAQTIWKVLDSDLSYVAATKTEINGDLVKKEDFRPYLKHLSQMDVQLFFALLADAAEHDALEFLPDIDVPTLIIAGEKDGFTPAWLSSVMHARIAGSEMCVVPMGTHTAPIEMPELVNLRLRRFLDLRVTPNENR